MPLRVVIAEDEATGTIDAFGEQLDGSLRPDKG